MPDNFVADEEVMIIAGCLIPIQRGKVLSCARETPYPAYKSGELQYIVCKFGLISVAPSGFSHVLQRLMSRLMGQQQGN